MKKKEWIIEKRKQGMEILVTNRTTDSIFVGECYNAKEKKRSHFLADIIVEALNKAEDKQQDEKNREGWVCIHCGESTYDNDSEQLFSAIEHIGCALKAEAIFHAKAEAKVQKAIRLGNEVTDEEA